MRATLKSFFAIKRSSKLFYVPLVARFGFLQALAGGRGFIKCDDSLKMFCCLQVPLSYGVLNGDKYDQQLCNTLNYIYIYIYIYIYSDNK